MKVKSLLLLFIIFSSFPIAKAQDCNCLTDLNEIAKAVKKAPSYKDGIKEKGEVYFESELAKIKTKIEADPQQAKNCSGYIQKYLSLFKDKHLTLYPDYNKIKSLSYEAKDKLNKIRPVTISQASRISGVSPSDISILLIYMGR